MASSLVESAPDFAAAEDIPADATEVFARHGAFVWRTLERLGVRDADREDLLQEVFMVVHRQLGGFAGQARLTTWLHAIALRVVSTHRRRAWVRRESPWAELPEARAAHGPEDALREAQERKQLHDVLELMSLEKRALFVMYELDQLPCQEIADTLGIPVGTVHSRLHAARQEFQSACARWQARTARPRRSLVLASGTGLWLGWKSLALAASLGVASVATVLVTRSTAPSTARHAAAPALAVPEHQAQPALALAAAPAVLEVAPAVAVTPEPLPTRHAQALTAPRRVRARVVTEPEPAASTKATDTLADELALLGRARSDLDRDPGAALGSLEEHARRFAEGKLAIERELLALDVLERLGRSAEAQRRAERLLGTARGTIYEARVRAHLHFE